MKRYNPKGKPTKAELDWMSKVASLPCVITGTREIQLHHLVECGRRLGNDYVLPLSVETHLDIYKITFAEQLELCKLVYERLGREWIDLPTKIVKRKFTSD
jgi:hypothetical protein